MATRTVGIDVGIRGPHVARVFDEKGKPLGGAIRLRPSAKDLAGLVRVVRSGLGPNERVVAVLEPTSMGIKRDLILAADVARKVDPELAQVYYRCMMGKGHHHNQALCAVATRLVNRIYAVRRDGRPYILRDLEGHPISTAEAKLLIQERFQVPAVVRQSRRRNSSQAA